MLILWLIKAACMGGNNRSIIAIGVAIIKVSYLSHHSYVIILNALKESSNAFSMRHQSPPYQIDLQPSVIEKYLATHDCQSFYLPLAEDD